MDEAMEPTPSELQDLTADITSRSNEDRQPPQPESINSQASLSTSPSLQCWICYATQEDDPRLKWIKPCKCRGGTKWVHQTCLQNWVDQKLRDDRTKSVACPQCRTAYLIHFPAMSVLAQLLDVVDGLNDHLCSLIVDCYVLASVYWSALTYGAMTVVYVGGARSLSIVQSIHPTVFLVGLPLIPVAAIIVGSIEWELHLCRILTFVLPHIPIVGRNFREAREDPAVALFDRRISERMLATRKCVTSIFLPTAAKLFGDLFYSTMSSVLRRFLAGGATFIGVKTTITYYHRRQIRKKLTDLMILDYTDENQEQVTANI